MPSGERRADLRCRLPRQTDGSSQVERQGGRGMTNSLIDEKPVKKTALGLQKYAHATLYDLVLLATAAEDLYSIIAEFPDEPEYWEHEMQAFDLAMEACPGTNA